MFYVYACRNRFCNTNFFNKQHHYVHLDKRGKFEGMRNLGNTCYLSSILQVSLHVYTKYMYIYKYDVYGYIYTYVMDTHIYMKCMYFSEVFEVRVILVPSYK